MTALGSFQLEIIETPTLGDRSYLVHDGTTAFVVDPQRDTDRVQSILDSEGLTLVAVFETHIHNDYVTGGLALARANGADYYVNAEDTVSFERRPITDGDVVAVGERMRVTAIATPGHTFTHLSYAITDAGDSTDDSAGGPADTLGGALAVFSGGSLLFGATGRPDLLGAEHAETLARHQHASAHRLADELPQDAEVLPTHGFGSFCAAGSSGGTESTIGQERTSNPVLQQDVDAYVEELLAALDVWPAYYAHMGPANAAGPDAATLEAPSVADPDEIRKRVDAGEWVVDLRNRTAFAAGHVPGTLNFGVDGSLATYLGWLIEYGTPFTLLGETAEDVATAQRELSRIALEPVAHAVGGPESWAVGPLASFATAKFADLAQVRHHRPVVVLDVRLPKEFAERRIAGAHHIPLHEVPRRLGEVPAGEVWVHCASGYRASVAASFLDAAGRTVVAIDDEFSEVDELALPMSTGEGNETA